MVRQNRPTAEKISRAKPLKEELPAPFGNEEKSGESLRQQEKIVSRVTLVCDYTIGEKSAWCCSCQYFLAISENQSIEKL
jgi:hypothetical protein